MKLIEEKLRKTIEISKAQLNKNQVQDIGPELLGRSKKAGLRKQKRPHNS